MQLHPGEHSEAVPSASVVIPAHNEEAVIGRCLAALRDVGTGSDAFEVIVVANGCTDETAARAREAAPDAVVLELQVASKTGALNAGDAASRAPTRIYLDADVELTGAAVFELVRVLVEGEVACAAPRMEVDLRGRPWIVRAFYRTFLALPYGSEGLVGNGVYALSREGRSRFREFPEITADDLFVRNLFSDSERRSVETVAFTVHPPRSAHGLVSIRERTYRGNAEYHRQFQTVAAPTLIGGRFVSLVLKHPLEVAAYLAVNAYAKLKLRFRRRAVRWERDESARTQL